MKEEIKEHFQKYWKAYVIGGLLLSTGVVITYVLTRNNYNAISEGNFASGKAHLNEHTESGKAHLNEHTSYNFYNSPHSSVVNVHERIGRGHPGYIIEHVETGLYYDSQKNCCDMLGINYQHMTDHINGRKADIFGNHFRRIVRA